MFPNCGIRPKHLRIEPKIVGGENSIPNAWPWLVRLSVFSASDDTLSRCGGTLITSRWILTAAHCFSSLIRKPIFNGTNSQQVKGAVLVHLPNHRVANMDQSPRDHLVGEVVLHPDFRMGREENGADIALLYMKEPVELQAEVNVACLPVDYTAPDHGTECYAVGWGELQSSVDTSFFDAFWSRLGNSTKAGFKYPMPQTQDNKMVSDQLREVRLTVLDAKECSNYYTDLDEKRILCAGSNGKGACFGDSGGGLYCRSPSSKAWFVAGVTSFGHSSRCGLIPGGFTSVNAHRGWIWRTIAHSTLELKVKPEQLIFERKLMERIKDEAGVNGLLDNTADNDQSVTTDMDLEQKAVTLFERKLTERIKDVTELLDNTAANDQFTTTEMELGQGNVTGSTRRSGSTFILIACSAICAVYFKVAG